VTLWGLLFLALVLVKANRTPRAWLILVPLLIVMLLWSLLKKAMPIPSSAMAPLDQLVISLAIGISIIFLLGHKIGNRHRFVTFLLAMLIMVLVCAAGLVSFGISTPESSVLAILSVLIATVMLFAFVLAGFKCRKKYGPVRFMLWLAIWMVGGMTVAMFLYYGIVLIGQGLEYQTMMVLVQVAFTGLVLGGGLYAATLPFMIFIFNSSFFRGRFFACLHLKSMPMASNAAEPVAQPSDFEKPDDTNIT
jgi:hypothetical protein